VPIHIGIDRAPEDHICARIEGWDLGSPGKGDEPCWEMGVKDRGLHPPMACKMIGQAGPRRGRQGVGVALQHSRTGHGCETTAKPPALWHLGNEAAQAARFVVAVIRANSANLSDSSGRPIKKIIWRSQNYRHMLVNI